MRNVSQEGTKWCRNMNRRKYHAITKMQPQKLDIIEFRTDLLELSLNNIGLADIFDLDAK